METTPRFYQVSLRTILEIIALVAVVLAFAFQRDRPNGRYQVSSYGAMNQNGPITGCYVVDTETGRVWHVSNNSSPVKIAPLP